MQINNKNLIIQESIKLFYQNGFNKTSMREIAKACNIAHPSIFNHFKNKTAIADVMFYRYLHGFAGMTSRYIKDRKIDISMNPEGMIFYWTAHYHYIKKDLRYFNFLQEHCTFQRMTDFLMVNYYRQIFKKFMSTQYNETLEKQLLHIRIITSAVLIISLSYHEDLISMEEAVVEHFHQLYSSFRITRPILDKDITDFLDNLDEKKYFRFNLLEDALLSNFGKPYEEFDIENLFA